MVHLAWPNGSPNSMQASTASNKDKQNREASFAGTSHDLVSYSGETNIPDSNEVIANVNDAIKILLEWREHPKMAQGDDEGPPMENKDFC